MKIFEIVKLSLLYGLEEAPSECPLARDLPFYLFYRRRPFTRKTAAKEAMLELGAKDCRNVLQKYYPNSGFSICEAANALVYIIGRELLYRLYDGKRYYTRDERDMPCYRLPINTLEEMLPMAQEWFSKNPDGLIDIWENTILGTPKESAELASL